MRCNDDKCVVHRICQYAILQLRCPSQQQDAAANMSDGMMPVLCVNDSMEHAPMSVGWLHTTYALSVCISWAYICVVIVTDLQDDLAE